MNAQDIIEYIRTSEKKTPDVDLNRGLHPHFREEDPR